MNDRQNFRVDLVEPVAIQRDDLCTPLDLIRERSSQAPNHIAFRNIAQDGKYIDITLPQFLQTVERIASRMIADGFDVGESACIVASTSYDWALAEWAIMAAGGVVVPIYESSSAETIEHIVTETHASIMFTDRSVPASLSIPVIHLKHGWETSYGSDTELNTVRQRKRERDDVASIVYTSGTSGKPRGTIILNRNFVDLVLNVHYAWREVLSAQGRTVIFLPLAHVLSRGLQMICMWVGMRITHISDPKKLVASLPEHQPTFLVIVPHVAEKIIDQIDHMAKSKHLTWVWNEAKNTAILWGKIAEDAQPKVSWWSLRKRKLFDTIFYRHIRKKLGGCVEFLLSGAARLDPELSLLFRGMGIPIMEGYGLTETTAPMAGNRPDDIKSGTVGRLIPGTSVHIDSKSQVWVRGIGVSPGYLDLESTQNSFSGAWFNTGDLGEIVEGKYLRITGRSKDVIVTSNGKTVSPAHWVESVEHHPLIQHAVVVGNDHPFLGALVFVNRNTVMQWFAQHGVDSSSIQIGAGQRCRSPELVETIQRAVNTANQELSRPEQVRKFRIIAIDDKMESEILTPTFKLKRHEVVARFASCIDGIYRKD